MSLSACRYPRSLWPLIRGHLYTALPAEKAEAILREWGIPVYG